MLVELTNGSNCFGFINIEKVRNVQFPNSNTFIICYSDEKISRYECTDFNDVQSYMDCFRKAGLSKLISG